MTDKKYKRPAIYLIGTILVVIGAGSTTISPFLLYLYFLPLWVFLLGLIFIWVSDRKIATKILWTIMPFIIFLSVQFLWRQWHTTTPETYLIPKNYKGKVHVFFNAPCGQEEEYENGRRIYRIPDYGILLTKYKDEYGFINSEYYLVDDKGKRTPLPKLDVHDYNEEWTTEKNPKEPSRDLLGAFLTGRVGSGQHNDEGEYSFQEFYVSTYRQLTDTFDKKIYDEKYDSLEYKLLKACGHPLKK